MRIKFEKKNIKIQMSMDEIKKQINQVQYIQWSRITLQSQHTFWDGGERNEGRGEKLLLKLFYFIKVNTH